MLDSSFKNCVETECPHLLSKTLTKESVFEKDDLNLLWKKLKVKDNSGPLVVNFCYDGSCNLSCPSCRTELQMCSPKSDDYKNIEKIHEIVINKIIKDPVTDCILREQVTHLQVHFLETSYKPLTNQNIKISV